MHTGRLAQQFFPREHQPLMVQLGVDPAREARASADQGGAMPQQLEQLALVGGPRIRLRDQAREEHAREESSVHPIILLIAHATSTASRCTPGVRSGS